MSKVLVHFGMHKAGSTYLQQITRHGVWRLKRAGICPVIRKGHIKLMKSGVSRGEREATVWADYLNEIDKQLATGKWTNFFLTDEEIEWKLSEERFLEYHNSLQERFDEVHYLGILRDPISYLASNLQQGVKTYKYYEMKFWNRLHLWLENEDYIELNFQARFRYLLDSGVNYRFVPLPELIGKGGPTLLAEQFKRVFDIDVEELKDVKAANTNLGKKGVAFASFFRFAMLRSIGQGRLANVLRLNMRQPFIKLSDRYGWSKGKYFPLDESHCEKIKAAFGDANNRFSQAVFGRDMDEVFDEKPCEKSVYRWADLDRRERKDLEAAFGEFMEAFYRLCQEQGIEYSRVSFMPMLRQYRDLRSGRKRNWITKRGSSSF